MDKIDSEFRLALGLLPQAKNAHGASIILDMVSQSSSSIDVVIDMYGTTVENN